MIARVWRGVTPVQKADAYLAMYEAIGPRPEPKAITACRGARQAP